MVKATFMGLICLTMTSLAAESPERVYTVCELLATPEKFNGKVIRVRGIVDGGMEGSWLRSDDCPERFYAAGYSLPKSIALAYHSEAGVAAARNEEHIQHVEELIRRRIRNRSSDVVTLTYKGIFETRKEWVVLTYPSGEKRLWGLGHDNAFPAQLVVTDISDPVVQRRRELPPKP